VIISLIAALDRNRIIGNHNQLPWHLPVDFAHFKATTMGKPILMGRKTFASIGKPLPGRHNIVLSNNPGFQLAGADVASSVEHACELAGDVAELMVIGGSAIYALCLPLAQRLYLTHVEAEFIGDAWFPAFDAAGWVAVQSRVSEVDEKNAYRCRFVRYEKTAAMESTC
jgi:dihydrofolate reductase